MSTPGGTVLVVEDDHAIARILEVNLAAAGFRVETESDGERGLRAVLERRPRAVVLDVGLPGVDGIEVCRRLRAAGDSTPILFATAHDDEVDRVLGLELGGDDYVVKPFSPTELVRRVQAVLRRTDGRPDTDRVIRWSRLTVDEQRRTVVADGRPVALTANEFDLLVCLMRRPGQVFDREQLLDLVWQRRSAAGPRTVDVHVAQVRAKLGAASPIETRRHLGYCARDRS